MKSIFSASYHWILYLRRYEFRLFPGQSAGWSFWQGAKFPTKTGIDDNIYRWVEYKEKATKYLDDVTPSGKPIFAIHSAEQYVINPNHFIKIQENF